MFEKHLWKSEILSKDVGRWPLPQVFFKHYAGENQLPGFYISGTLVENVLRNVNLGFPIVAMPRVAIIYFELGVVKNVMQKF